MLETQRGQNRWRSTIAAQLYQMLMLLMKK